MLGSVLELAQALSEKDASVGVKGGSVVPFTYIGLALVRGDGTEL